MKKHPRGRSSRVVALAAAAAVGFAPLLHAADLELDVKNGSTDLTSSGSYVQGTAPGATSDVTFLNLTYSPTAFTVNSALTIGSLNDLSGTALTISDTGIDPAILTLSSTGDIVPGSVAGDLIYVASGGNLTVAPGSGGLSIALGVTGNFDIAGTGVASIGAAVTGGFGLAKTGAGSLTLSGANTYTGSTTLAGGTLTLDFTADNTNKISTGALVFGGGSLIVNGNAGAATSQTVSGTSIGSGTTGGATAVVVNNGAGQTATLDLGALTRVIGGTVDFGGTGSVTTTTLNTAYTGGTNPATILGGYATFGNGSTFAVTSTVAGTNTITGLPTGSYATAFPAAVSATNNPDVDVPTGTTTPVAGVTVNTLRFNNAGAYTVTPAGALTVASGGILETTGVGNNAVTLGAAATTLTSGGPDLILHQYNTANTMTVSSIISGAIGLTKTGPGTVILTNAANTFTGDVFVEGGTLQLTGGNGNATSGPLGIVTGGTAFKRVVITNNATVAFTGSYNVNTPTAALPGNGQVYFIGAGGGQLSIAPTFTLTIDDGSGNGTATTNSELQGFGDLTLKGGGTVSLATSTSNFSVFTGQIFVTGGTTVKFGGAGNGFALGATTAGTTVTAGSVVDLSGQSIGAEPLTLNGTGISSGGALINSTGTGTQTGPIALASATSVGGASTLNLNGVISGANSLTKVGAGTTTLGGANLYTGGTTVSAGTLSLTNTTGSATGTGNITLNPTGGANLITGATGTATGTLIGSTSGTSNIAPGGLYAGGSLATFGALTVAGLTLTSNNTALQFDLSTTAGTNDSITVTGLDALTITGANKVPINLGQTPKGTGVYRLITFNQDGAGTVTANNFSVASGNGRLTYALSVDPGAGTQQFLDLTVSGSTTPITSNFVGTSTPTSWTVPANWSSNPLVPGLAGDTVTFNNGTSTPGVVQVNLDGQQRVGSLTFNNTGTTAFNIAPGTATGVTPALFFDNNGSAATLANSSNNNTISAPVTLVNATSVTVTGTTNGVPNTLTISGNINGAVALTLAGSSTGTLLLSGTNSTLTTGITVAGGTLRAGSGTAFGTGTTTVTAGGTVDLGGQTITVGMSLNGTGLGGVGALINSNATAATESGGVAIASATSIGGPGNYTLSGIVSGSGALTKVGTGTVTISNTSTTAGNTDTGAVVVNAGTLNLSGANAGAGAIQAPTITVNNGGTLQVGNNTDTLGFTANRNVLTINSGGAVLNNGSAKRVTLSNTVTMTGGVLGGTSVGDGNGTYSLSAATAFAATSDAAGNAALVNAPNLGVQAATTFNVTRGVATPASDLTISSNLIPYSSGTFGITKTGNGILTLTGANTYTGTTSLNLGTTVLNNTAGTVLGPTAITVGNGAAITATAGNATLLVRGTNTVGTATAGSITVSGGDAFQSGSAGTIGQGTLSLVDGSINTLNVLAKTAAATSLTLGSATLPSVLNFELGSAPGSNDKINLNNNLLTVLAGGTVGGTAGIGAIINITPTGPLVTGSYTLLSYGGETVATSAANGGGFAFANGLQSETLNGATLTLVNTGTAETLNVTGATINTPPATAYFQGSLGASFSTIDGTGNTNFTTDAAGGTNAQALPGSGTDLHFYATNANTGNLATTLDQPFTIKSLTLDGTATANVSIAPGAGGNSSTLTITPAAATSGITLTSGSGSLTITAPVVLGAAQTFTNGNTAAGNALVISGPSLSMGAFALTVAGTGPTTISAPISGTGLLTKTGAGTLTLSGGNSDTAGTLILGGTIASGTDNALSTGPLTIGDSSITTSTATGNVNLGAFSQTLSSLKVATNNATVNTITVGAGKALTINGTGGLTVGYDLGTAAAGVVATSTETTKLTVAGGGSLVVNNPAAIVQIGVGQTVQLNTAAADSLDVSGLSNVAFGTTAAPIAAIRVGFGQTGNGTLILSNTANTLVASTIDVGNSGGSNAGNGVVTLGTGTNALNADTITIGNSKGAGTVQFASQAAGAPGAVVIANKAGSGPATVVVGSQGGTNTGATATSVLNLLGHTSTVNAGAVTIGNNNNSGGSGYAAGQVSFDTGTFNATSLTLGLKSGIGTGGNGTTAGTGLNLLNVAGGVVTVSGGTAIAGHTGTGAGNLNSTFNLSGGAYSTASITGATKNGAGAGTATANINVTGGSLVVGTGGFTLANAAFASNAGTAVGSLTINGGSVTSNSDITDGGQTSPAVSTTAITLTSGLLDLKGHSLGSASALIDTLTFQGGTLQNVAQINNGAGLTKTGAGTMTLAGTNSFSGAVNVNGGTLLVTGSVANTAAPVNANAGSTLGGGGSVAGLTTVAASGTLAPSAGNAAPLSSPLTLTGGIAFTDSTSTYAVKLAAPAGAATPSYDRVVFGSADGGTASLNNATLVVNDGLYAATPMNAGDLFYIIDGVPGSATITGAFANGSTVTGTSGNLYTILYNQPGDPLGSGHDVVLSAVPEPVAMSLIGLGAFGLLSRRRRRPTRSVSGISAVATA